MGRFRAMLAKRLGCRRPRAAAVRIDNTRAWASWSILRGAYLALATLAVVAACSSSHAAPGAPAPPREPVPCTAQADCPAWQACMPTGRGVSECLDRCFAFGSPSAGDVRDEAWAGEHCRDRSQCLTHAPFSACYPPGSLLPGEPCEGLGECVDGYACSLAFDERDPRCVPTCVWFHYDDTECPDGTICTGYSICFPPCDPADPEICEPGELCYQGECELGRNYCEDWIPCPDGQLCDADASECVDPVEHDRRHPRVEGGWCHQVGRCPLNTH